MAYPGKNNSNNQEVKKSGCKLHQHVDHKDGLFMTVWKVEKGVMWSGKIFMSKEQSKTGIRTSKSGKDWVSVMLVLNAPLRNTVIQTGMLNVSNNKAYFKDWNYMCNPSANNGGYFGKHISKS